MNQITDNIWVGNSSDARNREALQSVGIGTILNVAIDLHPALGWNDKFVHYHVGLSDGENGREYYEAAVGILKNLDSRNIKVLVHCHEGSSRSCFIVGCHLIRKGVVKDIAEAMELLATKGRPIKLHSGHIRSFSP